MISVRSNGSREGNAFVAHFQQITRDYDEREQAWLREMREAHDPALIHPDDGWVDRRENSVMPCYPQYRREVRAGDLMVLGHHDRWRVVRCIGVRTMTLGPQTRYLFKGK